MMSDTTLHRIDDFARPHLPPLIRTANLLGRPFANSLSLDPDRLLESARRKTRLEDFGDNVFQEPFRVLMHALEHEAGLHPFGRFAVRSLVLQLLATRLRAEALVQRYPEILQQEVAPPIIIAGLPRTGTTHLHNLISQDANLRSLPYWESLEPVPDCEDPRQPPEPDPRRKRCEQGLRLVHSAMPLFPLMHEMEPDARHEEIQLLAAGFSTMLFESSYCVPSYARWYQKSDQTAAYEYLKRMMQILQWLDGRPRRWVLKSPQHLEQLPVILRVFPNCSLVQTHRDPVHVTASLATMVAYGMRLGCGAIDPHAVGHYWAERVEAMLRASISDRPGVPDHQVSDVRFHDFMADEVGTIERIYGRANQPFTEDTRRGIERYRADHQRGRMGRIDYRLDTLGLDSEERRQALRFYSERFGVSGT